MKNIIQYILIISICAISFTIATDEIDRNPTSQRNQNFRDWTETFETNIGPVTHTPTTLLVGRSKNGTILMESNSKVENKYSLTIEGIVIPRGLVLEVNSSREQFIQAMKDSGIID